MRKQRVFAPSNVIILSLLILLLVFSAVFSITNMKAKARDANRLSDINILQKIFDDVYGIYRAYDAVDCEVNQAVSACQSEKLLRLLPSLSNMKDPSKVLAACVAPCLSSCNYSFEILRRNEYSILFRLAKGVSGYEKGCYRLTEKGIVNAEY